MAAAAAAAAAVTAAENPACKKDQTSAKGGQRLGANV